GRPGFAARTCRLRREPAPSAWPGRPLRSAARRRPRSSILKEEGRTPVAPAPFRCVRRPPGRSVMDDLSAASRTFRSLSSFCRSFSRRARQATVSPRVVSYAELAPMAVIAETAMTHRELAVEQTEAAIDHFLELKRRWAEARRCRDSNARFEQEGGA